MNKEPLVGVNVTVKDKPGLGAITDINGRYKNIKCHNTLHTETGGFSMTINGKTIKVINAPVLHCKNCNSVIISDEVKEKAKEFSKVYLYPDNTLDYAECEAGTMMSVMNLLF